MATVEPLTREDLRDIIAEAIADSLDVDWQPSWGADAILARLDAEDLAIRHDLAKMVEKHSLLSATETALQYTSRIGFSCNVQWLQGSDPHNQEHRRIAAAESIEDALNKCAGKRLLAEDDMHDARMDALDAASEVSA